MVLGDIVVRGIQLGTARHAELSVVDKQLLPPLAEYVACDRIMNLILLLVFT